MSKTTWNKWIRSLSNTQNSQKQWYILQNFTSHIKWSFYRWQNGMRQMCKVASNKTTNKHYGSQHLNGGTVFQTSHFQFCLHLPMSYGLTFTEESRNFSLPKRVERVCDLGVILLYKGISLHPPLAHRQITQWLYATQYCMTTSSAWGVYHHVSFIWLEWSLIWSIGKLKIYVKFITEQMSSRICFSRRKNSENKPWLPQKLKHV